MSIKLEEIFARRGLITISRILASSPEKEYSINKLARIAGISPSEASLVIKKMRGLGMVRVRQSGKAFMISLNQQNYIWQNILKPILKAEATMPIPVGRGMARPIILDKE